MRPATLACIPDVVSDMQTATRLDDGSRQRDLEERLQQAQKMEIVGRLTSGVAHDFNNLVTIMMGYSTILLHHLAEHPPLYEAAEEINKASERAAALTRQLMAFSRKQRPQWRSLDLNTVVCDIEKMLRRLIGEDIELLTILDPDLEPVQADPGQIEQIIINLAVNARDAMPLGGRLTIATVNVTSPERQTPLCPGSHVKLSVGDTGCGMNAETRARLFEPFFTTKHRDQGTGLGLTMVDDIVNSMGGTIRVDSAPGLGTTFDIYLPRAAPAVDSTHAPQALEASWQGSETVLLVEDEEAVRTLVSSLLQQQGYTVLQAPHGKAALLLSARYDGPIHLLLTDVVMPHMSGHDLARCLRPVRPELRILYVSGYPDSAHLPPGVLDEREAFLCKPFAPDELGRRVRALLDQP